MKPEELEQIIKTHLEEFYRRRIEKLKTLQLKQVLKRNFYLKLIRLMCDYPEQQRKIYQEEWAKAVNRFTRDLLSEFANEDGSLDWEKIVRFNSGAGG
ncbi:MAG: PmeII family type II restriction endonuclease [Fimbriimonadales bacterium]